MTAALQITPNTGIVEHIAALWEQLAENARKRGEGERARWMQDCGPLVELPALSG